MTAITALQDRIPVPAKIGYGFGAVGGQIFRDTPALILPIYMITILGIPAWMAGIAILIPKAWIVFCDPLVGGWSDRRNATWGRAPFLLVGAILSGLTFVLMFSAPDFESPWASAAYMTFAFTLASTAYSLFSVPYLSAASEMSEDSRERTRLLSYRIMFLAVGVAIGAGYALPVARALGEGWSGFNRMGALYGLICAGTMLVTWFTIRRVRLITLPERPAGPAQGSMAALWGNQSFVVLAAAYFVALTAQAMTYTVFGLYFLYIIKDPGQILIVNLCAALSVIIGQPAALWLNRYLSKTFLYIVGIVGWSLFCFSWIWAGPQETQWLLEHTGLHIPQWLLLGTRGFLWGMFNSIYVLMALSFLTDTIARDRERSGISRSGLYSGVFGAIEKVGFALGPAIAGIILSVGGFVGGKSGDAAPQTAAALTTLTLSFCIYPAILKLASLLIFARYKEQ